MEGNGEKLNLSGALAGGSGPPKKRFKTEEEGPPKNKGKAPIELDLGLSTNGQFGVHRSRRPLDRSASVGGASAGDARGRHAPLLRTRSDPAGKGTALMLYSPAGSESAGKGKAPMVYSPAGSESAWKGKAPMVYSPAGSESDGGVGVRYLGGGGVDVQYFAESPQPGANQNTMTRCSLCPQRAVPVPAVGSSLKEKQKLMANALLNMPHVTTLGSCPKHAKIEGVLYRYRNADELKIVCICHGMFMTPAGFIKHCGGGDVADPLKHIVVDPSPVFQI